MKSNHTLADPVSSLFAARPCWLIAELADQLRRPVVSVRRLLQRIGYYSSFTHNSRWYTLKDIPRFDRDGLWFCDDIGFSRQGTLARTLVRLASRSPTGMTADELGAKLHSRCHGVLARLHQSGELQRDKRARAYVYLSADPAILRVQREELARQDASPGPLAAEIAVLILAAVIRRPEAPMADVARQVTRQSGVIVSPPQIERVFEQHGLKKTTRLVRQRPGGR